MSPIVLNRWRLVSFRGGKTAFPRPFTYLNYSCKPDIAKHRLYPWLCYGFFEKTVVYCVFLVKTRCRSLIFA